MFLLSLKDPELLDYFMLNKIDGFCFHRLYQLFLIPVEITRSSETDN